MGASGGRLIKPEGENIAMISENSKMTQTNLPKIVSPTAHGIIDYAHSAFFLGLGFLTWRSNRRAAWAALTTGGFILVQSLSTDYRFGAKPLISFKTHGKMDTIFATTSWMVPLLFGF